MADRGEVKIREGKLGDLIKLYQSAYGKVIREIETASFAGKIQRVRVMRRINVILTELGVDVEKWVKEEIPQYYLDGNNIALQDLRKLKIDIERGGLLAIDKEAIKQLIDETNLAFAEGIVGIGRNANRFLGKALKRQLNFIIAEGRLKGDTVKMIAQSIVKELEGRGLAVLVDRGGRQWQFDTYANMLVRTKAVEARNQGLANRMLASGYDLVQVSNHNSEHEECRVWEGKILSLTGRTPGYPTLTNAELAGLFHPNCQHAINVIELDVAKETDAYDNPFNRR